MASYGSPPYQESAFKAALRLVASSAAGLGAVRPGSNFGEAFMSSAGESFRQHSIANEAARRAAQAYALKQQEMEQAKIHDQIWQAQIEASKKPTPPPKPTKDDEAARILGRPLTDEEKRKLAGVYIAPKAAKTPKAEKPPKVNAKLQKELFALDQADDPAELMQVSKDPKLEPETRQRAWAKMLRIQKAVTPSQLR